MVPTVNDVPQTLGVEKVAQACHLVLQLPDELVVGVLIDDSVAADLLGTVSIPREGQSPQQWQRVKSPDAGQGGVPRAPPANDPLEDPSTMAILQPSA